MMVEVIQSQHSPDVLKSRADFLEPYGLYIYGELLDCSSVLSKRICALPRQRRIDFRINHEGKPVLKNISEASNNVAA